nr:hypothetical protein [Tanacetum cinerariifolium]
KMCLKTLMRYPRSIQEIKSIPNLMTTRS